MKNLLWIFSICLLTLTSCKKEPVGGPVFDANIDFIYRDSNNIDLLDPTSPGIYKASEIDTYWLTNTGEKRRVDRGNLTYPEMFRVGNQGYGYVMTVYFSPDPDCFDQNNMSTMFIRYKDGSEDVLKGEFNADRGEMTNSTRLLKLWVNNKLEWGGYPAKKNNLVLKK